MESFKDMELNKRELITLLNIGSPFLMLDQVSNISPEKSGIGKKTLKNDEWFFSCHFINEPVMPGTLQTEAMLQTAVSIIYASEDVMKKECLIVKSSSNFFLKIEKPGEIVIKANVSLGQKGGAEAKTKLYYNSKLASDGNFKFIIPERLNINE